MENGYVVVGIGHSFGNYEGNNYDNTMLHVTYENEKVSGTACKIVKVKTAVYHKNPVKINDVVDFNYDAYKNVKEIVLLLNGK